MLQSKSGKRDHWITIKTARQLNAAVNKKIQYHQSRIDFWNAQYIELSIKAKDSITTTNQVAEELGYMTKSPAFGGNGNVEFTVPKEINDRLKFIQKKRDEHSARLDDLKTWAAFTLDCEQDKEFELVLADYEYFFVTNHSVEE